MKEIISWIIFLIHIGIIAFVSLTPFIGSDLFVLVNLIFIAGIMIHWYLNNDVCALTVLESYFRGLPMGETFFGRIFGPVYTIGVESTICWTTLMVLVAVSTKRLLSKV